ncbi:CCA-adding enzyme [Chlamydiales bacterium SCGC AG-110-P3]|nr:CCA-adding enzyme [Chlamydiales bacterium SCGC AG-110-P3]
MEQEQDSQQVATTVVRRLVDAGFETYFAGGWVRDHLLGHDRSDIDIATSASPEEVMEQFNHTVAVGVQFGVVMVIEGGHQFEVSSFRKDGLYVDGRRPEGVEYATAEEDVHRRDFTINGMFYDPASGVIHDWVGGRIDLEKGVIRAIGTAENRFVEDRLRMIRAVRMAARFQFSIEPDTERAIRSSAHTLFPAVAMERVWGEFQKMSESPHFGDALVTMHRLDLLQQIFPLLDGVEENVIADRLEPLTRMTVEVPTVGWLMELFPDADIEEQLALARYLKVSNRDCKFLERLWQARQLIETEQRGGTPERIEWIRFYSHSDAFVCLSVALSRYGDLSQALSRHQDRYDKHIDHIQRLVKRRPLVTSQILRDHGIPPGKAMGALLREGERIAVNEDLQLAKKVVAKLKISPLWPEVT